MDLYSYAILRFFKILVNKLAGSAEIQGKGQEAAQDLP